MGMMLYLPTVFLLKIKYVKIRKHFSTGWHIESACKSLLQTPTHASESLCRPAKPYAHSPSQDAPCLGLYLESRAGIKKFFTSKEKGVTYIPTFLEAQGPCFPHRLLLEGEPKNYFASLYSERKTTG